MPTETEIKMYTTTEMERRWGVSSRTIAQYCRDGLIIGAKQEKNRRWYIPEDTSKPILTASKAAMLLYHFETEERRSKLREELEKNYGGYYVIEEYLLTLELIEQEHGRIKITKKSELLISKASKKWEDRLSKFLSLAKIVPIVLEIVSIIIQMKGMGI